MKTPAAQSMIEWFQQSETYARHDDPKRRDNLLRVLCILAESKQEAVQKISKAVALKILNLLAGEDYFTEHGQHIVAACIYIISYENHWPAWL